MESYLGTARHDQTLEKYHAQLDFLENNKYNSPWLNRVEVRIGSEDANVSLNEYRLRLSPSNPSEIRANKIYHRQHLKSINTEYEVALNEALKNRYELLIEHQYYYYLLTNLELRRSLFQEAIKSLSQYGMQAIDSDDLVDWESNMTDMLLKMENVKMEKSEIEYFISLDLLAADEIKWGSIPTIEVSDIREYINKEENTIDQNILVREAEEQLLLNEQMVKINKAEARSNIGYIQGNFDTERGDALEDHLGFQIGVRLPIVNPDKPDLNRNRFDLIEEQKEVTETKTFVSRREELLLIKLNHLFDQHELIQNRISRANEITNSNPLDKSINVFRMLEKTNYQLELVEKELQIKREIYETYIDLVDIKGQLVQFPLKNYLSPTFENIPD